MNNSSPLLQSTELRKLNGLITFITFITFIALIGLAQKGWIHSLIITIESSIIESSMVEKSETTELHIKSMITHYYATFIFIFVLISHYSLVIEAIYLNYL